MKAAKHNAMRLKSPKGEVKFSSPPPDLENVIYSFISHPCTLNPGIQIET
jgi:hypothetical protein